MRLSILLVALFAVSGCLGPYALQVEDYQPASAARAQDYYQCLQGGERPYSGARFGAGGGTAYGVAASGVAPSAKMVCACMNSNGYSLRYARTDEVVGDLIFLPLEIPSLFLGMPVANFGGRCP
jgi:hypothetical protein